MLLRGMLGLREGTSSEVRSPKSEVDTGHRTPDTGRRAEPVDALAAPPPIRLAPQLPPGWSFLHVRNLRWQNAVFDLDLEQQADSLSVRITPRTGTVPLQLELPLPPGAEWQPAKQSPFRKIDGIDPSRGVWLQASLTVTKAETFVVRHRPGITLVPLHDPMQSGDASHRLRVIDARFANNVYTVRVQGLRGHSYSLEVNTPLAISAIEGAPAMQGAGAPVGQGFSLAVHEVSTEPGKRVIEATFPAGGVGEWVEGEIVIRTRRSQ